MQHIGNKAIDRPGRRRLADPPVTGVRAAQCPYCGAPMRSARPPANNAIPIQATATP